MTEISTTTVRATALHEALKMAGAIFADTFGWAVAASYGDERGEHDAVRGAAGLIDLSLGGAIKVGGKEAVQFLNGLVTNNVKTLEQGKGIRAGFLTGHGKVRALCRILGLGSQFLILTDAQSHQKVLDYVFPFTYAGDFMVEDVSGQYRVISVQGPKSSQVIKEVCFEPVPVLTEHDWVGTLIAGQAAMVQCVSHTGEPGFDILTAEAGLTDVWDFVSMKGRFHGLALVGARALDVLRIEAGIPVYGIDVDESNMMLETGLTDAVSYNKGCYTGQEAVAMATYRGHVSKKLSGIIVAGDKVPALRDKILRQGKDVGYVTSATRSEDVNSTIALGYVKYGHFDPGTDVEIALSDGDSVAGRIVALPFQKIQA
jgi:folate-binding protein YgfZ